MNELSLDLATLRARYRAGLSPVAVIDQVFDRIAALDDPGIFLALHDRAQLRAQAEALGAFDPELPLWGVPCAVKDNIDAAGLDTTAGCPAFAYRPAADAPAVAALRRAGALVLGKTNLDQFATGLVGVRTPVAAPRNAFDPAIVPGGSSSGSAVAVAAGLVSFALGTDTAGSGRVPAGLNNLVGLKPSLGTVPGSGVVPACRTLDTISVFALTVEDAWAVYGIMAGADPADAYSRPLPVAPLAPAPAAPRLGIPRDVDLVFFGDDAAEGAWRRAIELARGLGASFTEIDMRPFLDIARLLYEGPWVAERHAAIRAFLATNRDDVLPVTRGIIEGAEKFSATDLFDGIYRLAELRRQALPALAGLDALMVPTLPRVPTVAELAADPLGPNARLGTWTNFVNLLDLAALAVPGPFRIDGLPAGVTLIGPRGSDGQLASLGRAFHAAAGVPMGATGHALPAPTAEEELIEIVVVGAHLSGMPLNGELTGCGARFRRAVATEPCYRLYALAGGPPRRPGLLRVSEGAGHAIATEVWALPAAAFGLFVAGLPAPLSIGTIRLDDGTRPKGFLVEAEAVAGAEDISRFGGWRAFIAAA